MLFATRSLARRIESAECALAVDFAERVRAVRHEVLIAPVGGAAAVFAGPGEPFNKLAGLGLGAPLDDGRLAEVEREFDRRAAPLQAEVATLADGPVLTRLAHRGYHLVNFENVLGFALTPAALEELEGRVRADEAAGLVATRVADRDAARWIEVTATGFASPDTFDGPASHESFPREMLARLYGELGDVPGFVRYLACRSGETAGGGSLRCIDGLAQLCGAATLPQHRRCGVQSALLRARLLDAARAGCDLAVVTTQPGSKSQQNVQRAGFELLYARAIMVRPPVSPA